MYRVWLKEEVDPGFREELMLAVSRLNGCRFCSWGHHEWAQISGVSDEELAQLEQLDPSGFDRRKWVAISYVRALVKENFERVQPELRRAMQHKYSPERDPPDRADRQGHGHRQPRQQYLRCDAVAAARGFPRRTAGSSTK